MLTRLCHEIAKPLEGLVTDTVPVGYPSFVNDLLYSGIQIFVAFRRFPFEPKVESHVVDACADEVDLFDRDSDVPCQLLGCTLHTVAKSHGMNGGGPEDCPTVHRHRIDIVKERNVGLADLLHVTAHVEHDRDGAQRAHDPSDTQRIADGLAQPVFLGDLEIDDRSGLVPADLKHPDGIVGPLERGASVQCRLDCGVCIECLSYAMCHHFRCAEP